MNKKRKSKVKSEAKSKVKSIVVSNEPPFTYAVGINNDAGPYLHNCTKEQAEPHERFFEDPQQALKFLEEISRNYRRT